MAGLITFTTFLWYDPKGRRNADYIYGADDVNRLVRQADHHLSVPHEFVCVTNIPAGLDPGIRAVPLDRTLFAPGTRFPKLQIFAPDAAEKIGERILLVDLDSLIVGPLDDLVDRNDDVVVWANPGAFKPRATKLNTSVVLYRAGSRPHVWAKFKLQKEVERSRPSMLQTDQMWISSTLKHEPTWGPDDGIYWITQTEPDAPPADARIVTFCGRHHPRRVEDQRQWPWVASFLS